MTSQASSGFVNQSSTPLSSFRRGIFSRISSRSKSQQASNEKENVVSKNVSEIQSDLHIFQSRWQDVRVIIGSQTNVTPQGASSKSSSPNDACESVINLTSEMVKILTRKEDHSNQDSQTIECDSRILDYFYSEEVLDRLLNWSVSHPEFEERMKIHLLGIFGSILSQRSCQFFFDRQILRPLFKLILTCASIDYRKLYEEKLAQVFNHLCFGISQYSEVLEILFSDTYVELDAGGHSLITTLLCFIHWDGAVGEQARDMLKVIICLASSHKEVSSYLVSKSNFCPILATGLTGLYSSLPRTLTYASDDWSGISEDDINACPDLQRFLTSLKFCDDIIKVLFPSVCQQLLDFIYNGFLVPVIAPGLHQGASGVEEVIATTSYLNLFINKITEPRLLQIFLKFVLLVKVDEFSILEILIQRIGNSQTKLCVITLILFKTLVQLNCEDVMYHLVFKYLLPCTHVMISQQRSIESVDLYCKNAEKILSLVPSCCDINGTRTDSHQSSVNALCDDIATPREDALSPLERSKWWQSIRRKKTPVAARHSVGDIRSSSIDRSEDSFETSYFEYLNTARSCLDHCRKACNHWSRSYTQQNSDQLSTAELLKTNSNALHVVTIVTDVHDPKGCQSRDAAVKRLDVSTSDDTTETGLRRSRSAAGVLEDEHTQILENSSELPASTSNRAKSCVLPSSSLAVINASLSDDLSTFLSRLDEVPSAESSTSRPSELLEELDSVVASQGQFRPAGLDINAANGSRIPKDTNGELEDDGSPRSNIIDTTNAESLADFATSDHMQKRKELEKLGFTDITSQVTLPGPMSLKMDDFGTKLQLSPGPSPSFSFKNFSISPTIGPFLQKLLLRLESMKQNPFYVNLHLTALIARLACFPQPLLTSILLSQTIVFQPSIKSLAQVLNSVKCRLEEYFIQVTDRDSMMIQAMQYLKYRAGQLQNEPDMSVGSVQKSSALARRSSLTNKPLTLLGLRQGARYSPSNPNPSPAQSFVMNESPEFLEKKNAIYCALVLKEFLKELAAISQEQAAFQSWSS